jgi:hypothetical protein
MVPQGSASVVRAADPYGDLDVIDTGFCTGCEAYKLGSLLAGRPFVSCPIPPQAARSR